MARVVMVERPRAPAPAASIAAIGASNSGMGDVPPGLRARQRVDPVDFAKEPDDLAEGEQRADRQHAEDEPVETRVGAESERDLLIENENDKSDQREERRHAHQKNTRGCEQADIRICRHGTPNQALKITRMLPCRIALR